jgi:hypothetical protein
VPTLPLTAALITAALLAGCAVGAAPAQADAPVVAAVIVKPRAPSDAAHVVRTVEGLLGGEAGVRYVRPMAGDAHILQLTAPATRERVPALVERLRASASFQYVELDSMMKIQ